MKTTALLILCFAAFAASAQTKPFTTAILKMKYNCNCKIQFTSKGKPVGQSFKMLKDSVSIAIQKGLSGFQLMCDGYEKPTVFTIPDTIQGGHYVITGNGKPCNERKEILQNKVSIKEFPGNDTAAYITNLGVTQGLSFFFINAEDYRNAKFYVIPKFEIADVMKLRETESSDTLKAMNYKSIKLKDEYLSKPGDLIYTVKKEKVSFYYHCGDYKEYMNLYHATGSN